MPLERLPADWPNAVAAYLAPISNLNLEAKNANTVEAPVDTQTQLSLGVDGLWRYVEAEVDAAVPVGGAATFDIVATTTANVFKAPTKEGEGETDETDYAFALQVVAHGTLPSGGGIAAAQKVGEVDWDGAKIIGIRQLVGDLRSTDPLSPTMPLVSVPALTVLGIESPMVPLAKTVAHAGADKAWATYVGATQEFSITAAGTMTWAAGAILTGGAASVVEVNGHAVVLTNDARLVNSRAPTGAAGGDLAGGYPDPAVATVLGGETPVTTETKLGGSLSGELPNPTVPALPPIGAVTDYVGFTDPSVQWLLTNGRAVSRATYATLLTNTTIKVTGTLKAASKTVTSIATENLAVGMKVEGAGIPANTSILTVVGGSITLSKEATATGSGIMLTFFPWGNGNETTTFNIPNIPAGVSTVGAGAGFGMGQTGGAETVMLTTGQLAVHKHGVTDPGHGHGVTDPGHLHGLTGYRPAFGAGFGENYFAGINGENSGPHGGTNTAGAFTGISINGASTGISTNNAGVGEAHPNMPPWVGMNHIVRVL